MRRPTPEADAYRWHRQAILGARLPRCEDEPQCGWFRLRAVRGGPWLPARIWLDQPMDEAGMLVADEELRAEILRDPADPLVVWARGAAIPRSSYEAILALHDTSPAMAATHIPLAPAALLIGPRHAR